MAYNITERVAEAREYFDKILDERLDQISELSGVERSKLIKINPMDFIEKNKHQKIDGYTYVDIGHWIAQVKQNDTYLISPEDAIVETANQISYKEGEKIEKKIRASKCTVVPVPRETALDFFQRNHRQSLPNWRGSAICYGLLFGSELVSVMMYDKANGGVRGDKKNFELVRLAIRHGYLVHGGASKLQAACEETLRLMGETEIFSYSNATINNGSVYAKLGFKESKVYTGQPFVVMENNKILRLLNVRPHSTDLSLAVYGRIKVHLGGNRMWIKNISNEEE